MEQQEFIQLLTEHLSNSKDNCISEETAIIPELMGMKIYDDPPVEFARR